jgi:putative membrane protein
MPPHLDEHHRPTLSRRALGWYVAFGAAMTAASAWHPHELGTWAMEVAPFAIVLALLAATHRRFPLTPMLYALILLHGAVLALGGHYTYARVPLGDWMREWFDFERNHYDRIGHWMQGFVPAIAAREVLLRRTALSLPSMRGGWLFTLVTAVCLAVSALYELVEWGAAVVLGEGAAAFLGTQGDEFDTQKDMFFALLGAIAAQALLGRWHDRQVGRLAEAPQAGG